MPQTAVLFHGSIRDNMNKLADFQSAASCHKMQEDSILADIPTVCNEHVVTSLVKDRIELVAGYVESHRVSAGIKMHLV